MIREDIDIRLGDCLELMKDIPDHSIDMILCDMPFGTTKNSWDTREFYNKSRRVKRGLFISNQGIKINADLNGAYQIMRKVVPMKWDSGCALHPVVVNIV